VNSASTSRRCWPRWLLLTIVLSCGGQIASADPLDLRLGDIRKFISPEELSTPLDDSLDEVVIRSPRVRSQLQQHIPSVFGKDGFRWLWSDPTQIWRLVLPNPQDPGMPLRSENDPREPPGAFRNRIGQPGQIYSDTYDPARDATRVRRANLTTDK
jgi:hypothetical protein